MAALKQTRADALAIARDIEDGDLVALDPCDLRDIEDVVLGDLLLTELQPARANATRGETTGAGRAKPR